MQLSNYEINIFLDLSGKCIIATEDQGNNVNNKPTFEIVNTKLYFPIVTLSTQVNEKIMKKIMKQDNEKLLQQLKTGFKRISNWNKYQSEQKCTQKTNI